MKTKLVLIIIIALSVIFNVILLNRDPVVETKTKTIIDTVYTTQTHIETITTPATIDTVYIRINDVEIPNITAKYTHKILQDFLYGKIDIEYSETFREFTVSDSLVVVEKTILKHEKITKYIERPFLQFVSSGGVLSNSDKEYSLLLGTGLRIADKIDLQIIGNSNKEIGLIATIRF